MLRVLRERYVCRAFGRYVPGHHLPRLANHKLVYTEGGERLGVVHSIPREACVDMQCFKAVSLYISLVKA